MTRFTFRATGLLMVAALTYACSDATAPQGEYRPQYSSLGPVIVECPTSESRSASATIGLLGGSFGVDNHRVAIPFGALLLPEEFELTVPVSNYMEIDVSAPGIADFQFQSPITITLDYSRCTRNNIAGRSLSVWHIDPVTKELLQNMGGVDDRENRRITFQTDHLSGFAIAE